LAGAAVRRRGVLAGEGIGVRERGGLKTVALDDVLVEVGRTLEGPPRPPEIVVGVGVQEATDEPGGLEERLAALARRAPLAARLRFLDLVRLGVALLPVARVAVGYRREATRIRREVLVDARIGIGAHRLALGGVDRLRARGRRGKRYRDHDHDRHPEPAHCRTSAASHLTITRLGGTVLPTSAPRDSTPSRAPSIPSWARARYLLGGAPIPPEEVTAPP